MLLVWGRGSGQSYMGELPGAECAACGEVTARTVVASFSYWHFWYIFSFLTDQDYRTVCQSCGAATLMEKTDALALFPRDNIPFIRKRGWMLCLGVLFFILAYVSIRNYIHGMQLRAMLSAPTMGDVYFADLARVPGSGYDEYGKMGASKLYGAMLVVGPSEKRRYPIATSNIAYRAKSTLESAVEAGNLEYSFNRNEAGEVLALSSEDLEGLWKGGVLYGGARTGFQTAFRFLSRNKAATQGTVTASPESP